jgi:HD superfamily phosphohydrolase
MKIIKDSIHGYIRISDLAVKIIATRAFERHNSIRQTSNAYRVFSSATHTRMSHQIGVYGLAQKALDSLIRQGRLVVSNDTTTRPLTPAQMTSLVHSRRVPTITADEYEWICIGGLVHDIGHGPSSHSFDELVERFVEEGEIEAENRWVTHERRGQDIFRRIVALDKIDLSEEALDYICNVIEPSGEYVHDFRFQLINNRVSGIDLDKMEYIARDSREFGLCCSIDIERIITNSGIHVDLRRLSPTSRRLDALVDSLAGTIQSVSTIFGRHDAASPTIPQSVAAAAAAAATAEAMRRKSMEFRGTYWSFNERITADIFHLFTTRFRLYKEIYNHPKVIKFELAYRDVLLTQKQAIIDAIRTRDLDAFVEMTDESMIWRATSEARNRFFARDTYRLVSESDSGSDSGSAASTGVPMAQQIRVRRFVGFMGSKGFNPFPHMRFFDKKTHKIVRIPGEQISSIFDTTRTREELCFDYVVKPLSL